MPNRRDPIKARDDEYASQLHASGAGMVALTLFFDGTKERLLEAVRHFDEFITTHPDNMLARVMRCECRVMNDYQLEEAVAECRLILEAEPKRARAWYCLGRALVRLQRWSEAVEPLDGYRKFFPDDLSTLLMLSLCYVAAKTDYGKALRYARKCVRLAPDDERAHEMVVRVLKAKGDEEGARRYVTYLMDYKSEIFNKLVPVTLGEAADGFEDVSNSIM